MIEGQTMFYIQTSLNEAMPSSLEVFMSEYAHLNFFVGVNIGLEYITCFVNTEICQYNWEKSRVFINVATNYAVCIISNMYWNS